MAPGPTTNRQYDEDTPSYAAPLIGFRSRKAAQLVAFFIGKMSTGMLEKLKLIKLIYLTERKFLAHHQTPILFDELYSLPHGPICSGTLNGIDGKIQPDIWDAFITRNGNQIVALRRFGRDDLDELSDAEISVADEVWQELGHMSASGIRNWSHEHCSEYTEVTSGRVPISYREVLEALGDPDAAEIDHEISTLRRAESMLLG